VATLGRGPIARGSSDYWENVALPVPPLPPSGLGGQCSIIRLQYVLEFRVDPVIGLDLVVHLGLTIGQAAKTLLDGQKGIAS
jgi:hypothetical protein